MRPYHWITAFVLIDVAALVIAPLWTVVAVNLATLGAVLGHSVWESRRGNPAVLWVRLAGAFVMVGLNFSALIVVYQGYNFDFARLLLRVALLADTLVAGLVFGAAVSVTLDPWWRRRPRGGLRDGV